MKSLFSLDPHTRLYVQLLRAAPHSLATGQISFLGRLIDRRENPIRFWIEWGIQALLLSTPWAALFAVLAFAELFRR
jgi:hypothetical protein